MKGRFMESPLQGDVRTGDMRRVIEEDRAIELIF